MMPPYKGTTIGFGELTTQAESAALYGESEVTITKDELLLQVFTMAFFLGFQDGTWFQGGDGVEATKAALAKHDIAAYLFGLKQAAEGGGHHA